MIKKNKFDMYYLIQIYYIYYITFLIIFRNLLHLVINY